MSIPRKILIRGYLAAEYRRAFGRGIAVVHRRRQLDRGDDAQSRAGGAAAGAAFTEQVGTQQGVPGVGRILGEVR